MVLYLTRAANQPTISVQSVASHQVMFIYNHCPVVKHLKKDIAKLTSLYMELSTKMRSIIPVGDITECIPDEVADIAVLEEPEHLNWYHHGRRWKNKIRRVIRIVHTNYLAYVRREKNGQVTACFLKYANI